MHAVPWASCRSCWHLEACDKALFSRGPELVGNAGVCRKCSLAPSATRLGERMIKLAWSSLASSSHCILLLFSAGLFQEVCVSQASSWVWLTRLGSHEGPVGGETEGEIRGWVGGGMYCGCCRWLTITGLYGLSLSLVSYTMTTIKCYVLSGVQPCANDLTAL